MPGGNVNLPLVGAVPARGFGTQALAKMIGERLKQGYVREPHVTVSIEAYRPFFILGEVTTPGQYPYVPNMTAENAVAVAGGFSPRAKKQTVELTRNAYGQRFTSEVQLNYPLHRAIPSSSRSGGSDPPEKRGRSAVRLTGVGSSTRN
jgi:polysaccharide export outer membrane protein